MKDDLDQLLRSLHLRKIAEIFDEEVKRAEKADTSYQEFVARLMRAQWQANQEAALAWRIKRAGLPLGDRPKPATDDRLKTGH